MICLTGNFKEVYFLSAWDSDNISCGFERKGWQPDNMECSTVHSNAKQIAIWRRYTLCAYMCLLSLAARGQSKWDMDVHTGAAITRIWEGANVINNRFYFQGAPTAGITIQRVVNHFFLLSAELNYDVISSKKKGITLLDAGTIANLPATGDCYADVEKAITLYYISAAALAKLYFTTGVTMYVEAGPFASVLSDSRAVIKGNSFLYQGSDGKQLLINSNGQPYPSQSIYCSKPPGNQLSRFNAGACTGIGIVLPVCGYHWLAACVIHLEF